MKKLTTLILICALGGCASGHYAQYNETPAERIARQERSIRLMELGTKLLMGHPQPQVQQAAPRNMNCKWNQWTNSLNCHQW